MINIQSRLVHLLKKISMYHTLNVYKALLHHKIVIRRNFCNKSNELDNIELPPEPTNCCMSGCANCVWIEYANSLAKLFNDGGDKARKIILDKVSDPNMKAFLSMELRILEMKQRIADKSNET